MVANEPETLQIDEELDKEEIKPLILNFQNGYTTDSLKTIPCKIVTDSETGKRRVTTKIDGMVYEGEEETEEVGNLILIIRSKSAGKVRVMEAGTAGLRPAQMAEKPKDSVKVLATTQLELSRMFGSKKSKQQQEHKERLKNVNAETVKVQVKNVTQNITKEKIGLAEYFAADSVEYYIPKVNKEAKEPSEIYNVDNIISPEQMTAIIEEIESTKDCEAEYHPFIKQIMSMNEATIREKVLAVYASCLFKLYASLIKDIVRKTFVACSVSATMNQILLSNFTQLVNNRRSRSTTLKDKTLCYAIVVTLIINNYKVDLESLAASLKMTSVLMATKARVTFASICVSGGRKIAQLKLPLPVNKGKFSHRKSAKF